MVDHKARFLEAEEQASQLVNQLSLLKREIETQAEASTSINELRVVLSTLVSELTQVSVEMQGIISKLAEIGGPKMLGSLDEIKTGVVQGLNYMQVSRNKIGGGLSLLKNSIDETSSKIGNGVSSAREEDPKRRLCPLGVPTEAMAPGGPIRSMVPAPFDG